MSTIDIKRASRTRLATTLRTRRIARGHRQEAILTNLLWNGGQDIDSYTNYEWVDWYRSFEGMRERLTAALNREGWDLAQQPTSGDGRTKWVIRPLTQAPVTHLLETAF